MGAAKNTPHAQERSALRAFGLAYPEAHTKSPWPGHADLAVRDKTFAYVNADGEPLKVSCKLPHSAAMALALPFVAPTEYGLGKSGWVTARFAPTAKPPVDLLKDWIDESYRAQAPKTLLKALDAAAGPPQTAKLAAQKKKAAPKKAAPKRAAPKKAPQRKPR